MLLDKMDGSDGREQYTREAYTHRYRDRLRHQKEKQQESTKAWVLSLPQHRLDLRCHSIASVKVDEVFHSTLYFQWCVRRFKKSLNEDSFTEGDGEWARLVFEYMMAESERQPFETYNLTDKQVLIDAKEVFGVVDESLALPSVNSMGMLQFGKAAHKTDDGHWDGMNCWTHRINRDANTVFETCRNEGLWFCSLPKNVTIEGVHSSQKALISSAESDRPHAPVPVTVPLLTAAEASLDSPKESSLREIAASLEVKKLDSHKGTERKADEETRESECAAIGASLLGMGMGGATEDKKPIDAGPKDTGIGDMSYRDACSEISRAISEGAPTYNKGDHKGCYEVYKATAEKILEHCSVGGVQKELRSALDLVKIQSTYTDQAWTLRHAFDAIRCGEVDVSDLTESDEEDPSHAVDKKKMTYRDACREIGAAIDKGAPTYNEGDHSGCYNIYKQTAENIVEDCGVLIIQLKLRSALEEAASQESFTDRAWTMRHTFDTILSGVFDVADFIKDDAPADAKDEEEEEEEGMSYEEACHEISTAISKGAPAYNEGDHSRCYNIYKQTADRIVECCSIEGVLRELRTALEDASKQESFTARAWTIRHAFDAVLRGHFGDAADLAASVRLNRDEASLALLSHLLGRRGTL